MSTETLRIVLDQNPVTVEVIQEVERIARKADIGMRASLRRMDEEVDRRSREIRETHHVGLAAAS